MNNAIVLLLDRTPLDRHAIRSLIASIDNRLPVLTASTMEEVNKLIGVHKCAPQLAILELQSARGGRDQELETFQRNFPHIPVLVTRDETPDEITEEDQPEGTLGLIHKDAETQVIAQHLVHAIIYARKRLFSRKGIAAKQANHTDADAMPHSDTDPAFYAAHGFLSPDYQQQLDIDESGFALSEQYALPSAREFDDGRHLGLTARQRDVLQLILHGMSNKAICRFLNLAEGTTKVHVSAILKSLRVTSRAQVPMAALRAGIRVKPLQLLKDLKALGEAKSLEDLKKLPLRRILDAQRGLTPPSIQHFPPTPDTPDTPDSQKE